jgi:hypothetical protein
MMGRRSECEEAEEEESNPTWKSKRTKDFIRQEDFISFSDNEGEEEGSEESESESPSDSDHESVHSDSSGE